MGLFGNDNYGYGGGPRYGFHASWVVGLIVIIFGVIRYAAHTQVNPVTGESQHITMTPAQEITLGIDAAPRMAAAMGRAIPASDPRAALVAEVGARLAAAGEPAQPVRRALPVPPARRPADRQRLRPAGGPDLHHPRVVRTAVERGGACRRAGARDGPCHLPAFGAADRKEPARPDHLHGRRHRRVGRSARAGRGDRGAGVDPDAPARLRPRG